MPIRSLPLKPSHLAAAIMLGLAVPGIGLAQDAAPPPEGTARTLDTVTVTGSRIKRTEIETQLPITVLQKERIDALHRASRFKFQTLPVYHNGLPMALTDETDYYK